MDSHEFNDANMVTATFELPGMGSEDVTLNVTRTARAITIRLLAQEITVHILQMLDMFELDMP